MHAHRHHHRHHTQLTHKSKKKLDDVRSDINVTPLVDVCLVLLIIFMVVADKLTRGKEVTLPKTRNHETVRENDNELIISITKDGPGGIRLWWDRDSLKDLDALKKKLDDEMHRKAREIFVKADADLTYGDIYPTIMAIHDSGSPGVRLSTAELKENK